MGPAPGDAPAALARSPIPPRVQLIAVLALGSIAIAASTGLVAGHIFAQPTTVKYLVTVIAPLLLIVACLVRDPLRLLTGSAIVTAPWDLNVGPGGLKLAPVTVLLALALLVALLVPEHRPRATGTASVVLVALVLLLPSVAIGREQPHYITWIATTLAAGWLAMRIAREPGGLRFLLSCVVAAATIQGLVAFYEYARHANLDLYSSEVNQTVSSSYFFNFGNTFRPSGTLPDPDSLGNVLALACPLAFVLALSASSMLERLAWVVCAGIVTVALTLSFSRMSWIGGAAGVAVVVAALPSPRRLSALAAVCALLAVTVTVGLAIGGHSLSERFNSIENPTARTNRTAQGDKERERIWSAALAIASQQPLVGTGTGRLQEHLSEHLGASVEGLHAQSVYLQFLAQSGIAGLLALLLLVAHALTGVIAGMRRQRMLLAGVGGSIVAILLGWTTDTTARYTSVSVIIAFVFAAAMAQHIRVRVPEPMRRRLVAISRP